MSQTRGICTGTQSGFIFPDVASEILAPPGIVAVGVSAGLLHCRRCGGPSFKSILCSFQAWYPSRGLGSEPGFVLA